MLHTILSRFGEKFAPNINLPIRLARETGIALRACVGGYIFDLPAKRWRVPVEVFAVREGVEPESICDITLTSAAPPPDEMTIIHYLFTLWRPLSREDAPCPPLELDASDPYREVKAGILAGFHELAEQLEAYSAGRQGDRGSNGIL